MDTSESQAAAKSGSRRLQIGFAWIGLALACVWLTAAHGPLTGDSYVYVAAARSLATEGRLALPFAPSTAGSLPVPYTTWGPGFPVVISVAGALGLDFWLAARWISLLGLLAACGLLQGATRRLPGGSTAVLLFCCTAVTALVATTIWSEGPFLCLSVAAWWLLCAWAAQTRKRLRELVLAAALIGLAMLFRYAGLALAAAYLAVVWIFGMRMHRLVASGAMAASCLPVGLWFLRNHALVANWRGARIAPPDLWRAPAELCFATGELLAVPWVSRPEVKAVVGALLLILLGFQLLKLRRAGDRTPPVVTAALFAVALAGAAVVARATGTGGNVSPRLIWPALPFLFVLVCALPGNRLRERSRYAILTGFLLTQAVGLLRMPQVNPRWNLKQTAQQLPVPLGPPGPILANRAWVMWKLTGRSAYFPTHRLHHDRLLDPDSLVTWAGRRGVELFIWQNEDATPEELRARYGPLADVFRDPAPAYLESVWTTPRASAWRLAGPR